MINVSAFALRDCDFVGNYFMNRTGGAYGGALHVLNSSGVVSNTFFRSNTVIGSYSVGYGGAINVTGGSVALRDITLIANNSYGQWASETRWYGCGGGISFNGGSHSLSNAVLFLNETQRHIQLTATEGGGIYVFNNASVAISHATIAGHSSDGLYVAAGNVTLRNSILANNYPDIGGGGTVTVSHSLVSDGTGGESPDILSGDPLFDEEWFYLTPESPCLNSGLGTVAAAGLTGYTVSTNGAAELAGTTVSMGYHYPPGTVLTPFSEVYVSPTGDDEASGDAAHPFRTIARALQASGNRLRVHLLPGIHDSAAGFPLQISNRATTQFVGGNPQTTIIDGKNAANKRLFEYFYAFGNNRISGVTLRNGGGELPKLEEMWAGGAIYLACARLTIENCIVSNNINSTTSNRGEFGIHVYGGGAIGAKQAALTLSNSTFAGNTSNNNSSGGGAILTHSTVGTISDCVFSNNVVNAQTGPAGHNRAVSGGALHLGRSSFAIRDCLFIGNKAIAHKDKSSAGGALFYCDGRVSIRNSIFASNHITNNSNVVTLMGAAVYQHNVSFLSSARKLSLENCTIVGNTSDGITGNGVYGNNNYMELVNTILLSNQPHDFTNLTAVAFSHCRADRLISGERGNITADPLLINPAGGNFGLRTMGGQYTPGGRVVRYDANSPCIDGGTNLNWMAAVTDLRGFARLAHGLPTSGGKPRVDMGAIEVHIPRSGTTMIVQ